MLARIAVPREHAPLLVERLIRTYGKPRILQDIDEPTILFVEFTIEDDMREEFSLDWAKIRIKSDTPGACARRGIGNLIFLQTLPQHIPNTWPVRT